MLGADATRAAIDTLYDLACGGNVLELAVGIGRLALPLGSFDLIFVAFFFALPTQDLQVAGFETVATHLKSGGAFVIEAFVPDITRFHATKPYAPITFRRTP